MKHATSNRDVRLPPLWCDYCGRFSGYMPVGSTLYVACMGGTRPAIPVSHAYYPPCLVRP